MVRRWFAAVVCVVAIVWTCAPARATGNYDVTRVLTELRSLSDAEFAHVVSWSRAGTGRPGFVFSKVDAAENNILALHPANRDPILSWLRGHGRSALHALSLSDADIGPRRGGIDGHQIAASATQPSPWRELTLATASLQPAPSGDVKVVRGFAAAKKDGTGASACITFRNVGTKVANRLVVEFPLLNAESLETGVLTLDRHGTFSPNVDIAGYDDVGDLSGNSMGPRGRADNCATLSVGVAAVPILTARFATYRITRVEYTDGGVWTPPENARRSPL